MNNLNKEATKNIYQILSELEDHRRKQGTRHPLHFVLLITIMALMSGITSITGIEDFAKRHKISLCNLFQLTENKRRVPSRKTIERVLAGVDFLKFTTLFYQWAKQKIPLEKGDWLAMDGKAIKGTLTDSNNAFQNFTTLVSVFSHKQKQILALDKFDSSTTSEIIIVRNCIKMLDLEGVVFTLDALHCQKKTVAAITSGGNDFVIGLKQNQKKLYSSVKKNSKDSPL